MNKEKMAKKLRKAIEHPKLCRCFFKYNLYYWYYFPMKISERLFLGIEENDFILDGYSIRRLKDLERVEYKKDKCFEILQKEGILDNLTISDIDITSWKTTLLSLQKIGKNIIIEHEEIDENRSDFVIGRIEKVKKKKVRILPFDADGKWYDEPVEIPFKEITSVTAESRYVKIFSKYLSN